MHLPLNIFHALLIWNILTINTNTNISSTGAMMDYLWLRGWLKEHGCEVSRANVTKLIM